MEEKNRSSLFDVFAASQETLAEAKNKAQQESGNRTKHFRIDKDGDFVIRILPLAPILDADGNVKEMPRKGYEYPTKSMVLPIIVGQDKKGNDKYMYVNVRHAKYAFKDLPNDLIDLYVELALQEYADDEKLCAKIKGSRFDGGLKWDSKRAMYVLDMDKRSEGIQLFELSYAQYKDLEERKLALWGKLEKKGRTQCPISAWSAFPVEISRKTEKKKVSYSFNIDALGEDELSEVELSALLDAPRLPELLYKYTRYQLEATIEFLTQYDEQYDMNIMTKPEIKECIEDIKLRLPSDDQSHFSKNGSDKDNKEDGVSLQSLWEQYEALADQGLDDRSEEGQNLRGMIREFIDKNELEVKFSRSDSNRDILEAIEDYMSNNNSDDNDKEEEEEQRPTRPRRERVQDNPEPDPDSEDEERPARPRRERNEDTMEPAQRPERRTRPARRS